MRQRPETDAPSSQQWTTDGCAVGALVWRGRQGRATRESSITIYSITICSVAIYSKTIYIFYNRLLYLALPQDGFLTFPAFACFIFTYAVGCFAIRFSSIAWHHSALRAVRCTCSIGGRCNSHDAPLQQKPKTRADCTHGVDQCLRV